MVGNGVSRAGHRCQERRAGIYYKPTVEPKSVLHARHRGYERCLGWKIKPAAWRLPDVQVDGAAHVIGDVVLSRIDEDLQEVVRLLLLGFHVHVCVLSLRPLLVGLRRPKYQCFS